VGPHRRHRLLAAVSVAGAVLACAEIGTAPEQPAAIEMVPFPSPSIVVGDTLRSIDGVVAPVRAIVRNTAGDAIENAPVRYLYADFNRDTGAVFVDSLTGIVVARRAITGDARIAARVGPVLQVIRNLIVTVRPDTLEAGASPPPLSVTLPDTGRSGAQANSSQAVQATLRNLAGTSPVPVNGWVVRFGLRRPLNAANDTSAAVFLVDDQGRASTIDTTDNSGTAGRRVRVRAASFPTTAVDTVEVQLSASYRGRLVPGASQVVRLVVRRGAAAP
jgi:hypothetical protein